MSELTATYSEHLEFPIIVECEDGEHYSYSLDEGEYSIGIDLVEKKGGPKNGFVGSGLYKRLVDKIDISVTKEVGDVPKIPLNERGGRDFTTVSQYFRDQNNEYAKVAKKFYKNLIRIIKYDYKQPFRNEDRIDNNVFSNPCWQIKNGEYIGFAGIVYHVQPIPGMSHNTLGALPLKMAQRDEIENKLKLIQNIELYQEILSDAQAAIFSGDIRRAIFEMAIVCELSTKRKYFSEGGVAGLAFDYFEDKGKVKATVIELITSVAEEVLGESFKAYSNSDYINIDYLIRCRNKVAHRGQVLF